MSDYADWYDDDLLNHNCQRSSKSEFGRYFVFKENCQEILDCLPGDDIDLKKLFLSNLRIYPNQPNVTELDQIIHDELMEVYQISSQDSSVYCHELVNVVQKWWERKGKARFLESEDKWEIWKCVKVSSMMLGITDMTDQVISEIENMNEFGIQFNYDDELTEKLAVNDVLNLHTVTGTIKMAYIKFCQNLKISNLYEDFIILNIHYFINDPGMFKSAWYKSNKKILILVCENVSPEFNVELLVTLFNVNENFNYFGGFGRSSKELNRKIVFIDLPDFIFETLQVLVHSFYDNVDGVCGPFVENNFQFHEMFVSINFSSLSDFSQTVILSKEVRVTDEQNRVKTIQLKNLKNKNLQNIKEHMHIDVLWMLMQNQKINLFTDNLDLEIELDDWFFQLGEGGDLRPFIVDATKIGYNLTKKVQDGVKKMRDLPDDPSINTASDVKSWVFSKFRQQMGNNEFTQEVLGTVDGFLQQIDTDLVKDLLDGLKK